MRTSIEYVHEWHRQNERLLGAGKVRHMGVERDALLSCSSLGDRQADTQDGIGSEVCLVLRTVHLDQELIDF
jgi:hypothetical protein